MTPEQIRERVNNLTVWSRGGERAPHKPLLAIYAIARLVRGEPRMIPYADVDRNVGKLLMEFGPMGGCAADLGVASRRIPCVL